MALVHSAYAQSMNASDDPCRGVVATSDLTQCFELALKKSDKKLGSAYVQIQRVLTPKERKDLVQAQRVWVQYRDATCTAVYDLYGGGTAGPPTRLACLEAETRARETSLQRSYGWLVQKFGS